MLTARFEVDFDAPIDVVWATLIDYPGYARFPHVRSARLVEPGTDHPSGVGALREIDVDGIRFKERIVEFRAPNVLAYRITESRPIPLVHDIGRMELSERGERTHLLWETTFTVGVPVIGDLLAHPVRLAMRRTFGSILRALQTDFGRGGK